MFVLALGGCGGPRPVPVHRVALLPLEGNSANSAALAARFLKPTARTDAGAPVVLGLDDLRAGLSPGDLTTVASAVRSLERLGLDEGLLIAVRQDENRREWLTARRWRPGGLLDSVHVPLSGNRWATALAQAFPGLQVDSSAVGAAWPEDAGALQRWGQGLRAMAQGDPAQAEAALREAVHRLEKDERARLDWAASLLDLGLEQRRLDDDSLPLWIEAESALRSPVDSRLEGRRQQLLGRCWLIQDRWNWAETALRKAYHNLGENPDLLFDLSRLHPSRWPLTGFKSRNSLLNHILDINPVHVQAALALGDWLTGQGGSDQALAAYDHFLIRAPRNLDVLMAEGRIHVMENRPVRVIETYSRVIERAPDFAEAYYNLGIAYYNSDRRQQAKGFF